MLDLEASLLRDQRHFGEALACLAEAEVARRAFDQRNMSFDVALTLLEEAILLLEEGRVADVKLLARISKRFSSPREFTARPWVH